MAERGIEASLFAGELRTFIREKERQLGGGKQVDALDLLREIEEEIERIEETYENA